MADTNDMKRPRLSLRLVILVAGGFTVLYTVSLALEPSAGAVLGLFACSVAATLYMVLRILKDPSSTDKTFDEYFYQDREDLRRNGRE